MGQESQAARRAQDAESATSSTLRPHPLLGSVIKGRYRIVRCIGHGAMGNVFEVVHEGLRTSFALKQLRVDLEGEASIVARFRHEAEMMARLAHPNVVRVFDIDTEPGFGTWMAMELIDGVDLGELMRRRGRLAHAEVRRIGAQIASALDCAHRAGLVHRDIKPPNVLIEHGSGRAVLTDFGVAKHVGEGAADVATRTGAFLGTYRYSSPEQIRNQHGVTIDGRADLYSLGVVLYEMVSGRKFLDGWSESEIVSRVGFAPDWRPPLGYDEPPPADLAGLIAGCVEPARDRRVRSAGEVAARLSVLEPVIGASSAPDATRSPAEAGPPGPRRAAAPSSRSAGLEATAATVGPTIAPRGAATLARSIRSASRAGTSSPAREGGRRIASFAALAALIAGALLVTRYADLPLDPRLLFESAPPPVILSFEPEEKLVTIPRYDEPRWFSVVLDGLDPERPPKMRWLLDDEVVAESTTIWEYDPQARRTSTRKPAVLRFVVGRGRGVRESHVWWIQTTVPDLSPVLRSASVKPGSTITAQIGDVVEIAVDAYDPDGDPLSYAWRLDGRPLGNDEPAVAIPVTRARHLVSLAIAESDGDATVWSTWEIRSRRAGG